MAFKGFLHLAFWSTVSTLATATSFTLSSDITDFIPSCAQDCFDSFVNINYPPDLCSTTPSLQCLCAHDGSQGFTLGEGALQCVIAEDSRGACQGNDASSQVVQSAYSMCVGQANAVSPTHSTIVATLLVPQGTGPVQLASPTTIEMSTMTPASSATATQGSTSTSFPTGDQSQPTFAPVTTMASNSNTTASIASGSSNHGLKLSPTEIIGISLGGTGLLALLIALICVTRILRRRKQMRQTPGFRQMRDSWGLGWKHGSPQMPNISAPVLNEPQEMDHEYYRPVKRFSLRPGSIGVALSPERSRSPADQRPMAASASSQQLLSGPQMTAQANFASRAPPQAQNPGYPPALASPRLLGQAASAMPSQELGQSPPKPNLTLNIPEKIEPSSGPRTVTSRESVVTEFAEDGDPDSAVIWRPPPSNPTSAKSAFGPDKWGNWMLGNPSASSEPQELEAPSHLTKTRAERAHGASNARASPGTRQSPASLGVPDYPLHRSSSVYSNYSLPRSVVPDAQNPMPAPVANPESYYKAAGRQNAAAIRPKQYAKSADRTNSITASIDSATTIDSSQTGGDEAGGQDLTAPNLSPVAESPNSPSSPVSYPKILPSKPLASPSRPLPSPGRPLASPSAVPKPLNLGPYRASQQLPASQLSPTMGAVFPASTRQPPGPSRLRNGAQQQPALTRPNPAYVRDPAQIRTGSPEMRGQTDIAQAQLAIVNKALLARPTGLPRSPSPHVRLQDDPTQQPQDRLSSRPQLQQHQVQRPFPSPKPMSPPPPPPQQQQRPSPRSQQPHVSGLVKAVTPQQQPSAWNPAPAGSLLAKRVGAERAAALAFSEEGNLSKPGGGGGEWRRQQDADLPSTPGWQPKLTPTRRGHDLVLNVQ